MKEQKDTCICLSFTDPFIPSVIHIEITFLLLVKPLLFWLICPPWKNFYSKFKRYLPKMPISFFQKWQKVQWKKLFYDTSRSIILEKPSRIRRTLNKGWLLCLHSLLLVFMLEYFYKMKTRIPSQKVDITTLVLLDRNQIVARQKCNIKKINRIARKALSFMVMVRIFTLRWSARKILFILML